MTDLSRWMTVVACLGSILISGVWAAEPASPPQNQAVRTGVWVGGIGSLDDDTLSWFSARVELESDGDDLTGRLKTDGRGYSIRLHGSPDDLKATVERKKKREFSCEIVDGVIVATIDDGNVPNRLMLRRIDPVFTERLLQLSGVYETEDGQRLSIRLAGEGLALTNFTNGEVRNLYPVGDDEFVCGPALGIPTPVETIFRFQRRDSVQSTQVSIQPVGGSPFDARLRPGLQVEEFVYDSFDGTKIAGSVYRPRGEGPFPAFVWVHGSGPATRYGAGSWPHYFADLGFAVLAVDKRGVGKSGGKYSLPGGGRDNFPHMRRRSKDVAAAVKALRERDDIVDDRIGLVGGSQAGWVIPMTTDHTDLAYAVILFGGATPLSVESKYSRMASENASGSKLQSVDELIEELRSYEPSDIGIEKELAQMQFPALWIYGNRDRSNPSQVCEDLINRVSSQHNRDFTVETFPNGNHGMLECRFGGSAEARTLTRLVPDLHATIAEWLVEKDLMPK